MTVALGSDHGGFALKQALVEHLNQKGVEFKDFGVFCSESADYPDIAVQVAEAVACGEYEKGVILCGTGVGVSIAANKVPGIRAAQTHDTFSAERAAKSNNAHIITLGARVVGSELAKAIVDSWLAAEFDPAGASVENVLAINAVDRKYR